MTIRSSGRVSAVHWLMKRGCFRSSGGRHRQCRLADARLAGQPRRQGKIALVHYQPAGQKLSQDRVLTDPALLGFVRCAQMERHPIDLDGLRRAGHSRGRASDHGVINLPFWWCVSKNWATPATVCYEFSVTFRRRIGERSTHLTQGRKLPTPLSTGQELPRIASRANLRVPSRPARGRLIVSSRLVPEPEPWIDLPATHPRDPIDTLPPSSAPLPSHWSIMAQLRAFRTRLISGLLFTLPIVITFWIVYWLYLTASRFILNPLATLINRLQAWLRNSPALQDFDLPEWWYRRGLSRPCHRAGPGSLVHSRFTRPVLGLSHARLVLATVPVVATIYRAVRNVVDSVGSQFQGGSNFKRVVLVEFPHPGIRSLALVTNSLRDNTTGRSILSVCVLTGVMPPSGFTLYVPEEDVTNIAWSVNDTLQAILSGGLTSPPTIHYFKGINPPLPVGGGPIVDAQGNALGS